MKSLTVLLTNAGMRERAGTELYVRDLACGLLAKGHRPVIYSPRPGKFAQEIREETIPVVDDLSQLSAAPDIIHGQHANETLTALLHFADVPGVFFCHDWYFREDFPPQFPRILRYVAVDQPCFDKLVCEYAVPEERVRLLYQFVDLERFQGRGQLPVKPTRALILCNYTKENEYLAAARAACAKAGVTLDVFGLGVGRPCSEPEKLLRDYDIVFAKGRTALEAMAVGNAVTVYWWRRLGPMVTLDELERLQRLNFGVRAMSALLTPEEFGNRVGEALASYNSADAAAVTRRVRAGCGRDLFVNEVLKLYEEVIEAYASGPPADPRAEARAAAVHLREISMRIGKQREAIDNSTPLLLTKRVLQLPILGGVARAVARAATGRRQT